MQQQYDLIYEFFKTTTEPFDELEWDGETLIVCLDNEEIERYNYTDLKEIIPNF